jgi:hypothetical protein
VIEVVAEQAIGTFFPVRRPDGTRAIVEPYRQDLPWTAPPPTTGRWTTDEEIQAILAAVDIEVDHLTPVEGGLWHGARTAAAISEGARHGCQAACRRSWQVRARA